LKTKELEDVTFLYSALDNYGGYPFNYLFDVTLPVYSAKDMVSRNGALVLWGGADISPAIYGERPGSKTGADINLSSKDQLELQLAGQAIKLGIPIIGICRGAQMACALAGGKLVQHVDNHTKDHFIATDEGKTVKTTSLHHQMMFPWETDHKLIAWSSPDIATVYKGAPNEEAEGDVDVVFPEKVDHKEPEIVYFPGIKALAIQGHPEFIHNEKHEFVVYCQRLVKQYLMEPFLHG
jgi:putative glutamine amidotransferase